MTQPIRLAAFALLACLAAETCLAQAYNPYAEAATLKPVAPDGTLQWGTYFKSAQLQRAYERLWSLGACRGTNRAITDPVEDNKVLIDRLPEAEFSGTVQAASGTLAGGVVAFNATATSADAVLYAQLHPAGVSHLTVTGTITPADLRPGMVVRFEAEVDAKGRGTAPLGRLEVVTPPAGFKPQAVVAGRTATIVGGVFSVRGQTVVVRVDAGRLRRLTFTLDDAAVLTIDGAYFDLVKPGDAIALTGRLWSGAGTMGAGTIFSSHLTVTKRPPPPRPESRAVATGAGAGAGRPVE